MTRALLIVDHIATQTAWGIPDALAADLLEADGALASPTPTNVLAKLATAATALAEQTYLDVYDDYTAGRIGDDFDTFDHFDSVMANFHNRMIVTLRFMRPMPLEWLPDCTRTITSAYSERMQLLGMTNRGGMA